MGYAPGRPRRDHRRTEQDVGITPGELGAVWAGDAKRAAAEQARTIEAMKARIEALERRVDGVAVNQQWPS